MSYGFRGRVRDDVGEVVVLALGVVPRLDARRILHVVRGEV